MQKHYFHDVARSERYFTATLLPHLLMADGFRGIKLLFKYIFDDKINEPDDFEIVTELDPVRDGSVYNSNIKKIFKESGRIAVPDIFIRWGMRILAIEAKFFTQPTADELNEQIKLQWDALSAIISSTHYDLENIHQCLLIINEPIGKIDSQIKILTWSEILDLLTSHNMDLLSNDNKYAFDILRNSIKRAKKELAKTTDVTYSIINDIETLVSQMPSLIESGNIWVGFSEGIELDTIDLNYLRQRDHYRVSDKKYTSNWIRIDELITKYISLKFE